MNQRDKQSSQQPHQNPREGNRSNLKNFIFLTSGLMILTAVVASAITVVVLQRLGLIAGNSSSRSPSPTIVSESPIPVTPSISTNPSPSSTSISESPVLVTPSISTNPSPSITPSSGVLYTATNCLSDTPGIPLDGILHSPNNSTITVGKEFVSEIANISYNYQLSQSLPLEFVCNLHSSYKELKLVFGVNDANNLAHPNNKIQLEVLLDNKSAGTRQVTVGAKQTWILNAQDIKTVALKVGCTSACPPLSFMDMGLK